VEGDGFELNVNWLALPSLELYFNTGYLDATDRAPDNVDADGLGGELASDFSDGSPSCGRTEEPRMYGMEFRYNFR